MSEMQCVKNGIGINYGHGHVYPGDKYRCPKCESEIIISDGSSIHDPNLKSMDEYYNMEKRDGN